MFLADDRPSVEGADGEVVGLGFRAFLDEDRTIELTENGEFPVLPGVFYAPVDGVSFHDDVLPLRHFDAGNWIEIRPEPGSPLDRSALAVYGGGLRVGYVPGPIAKVLAPSGTRIGRGVVVMEWSSNGIRQGISILGSMHVNLEISIEE